MPWTFAHPAAVLPLRKLGVLRLPLLGLILGSIAPDLGYYAGRLDVATFAHSWPGVLLFCAPVSVTFSLLVIRWRRALTAPLPSRHRDAIDGLSAPETATLAGVAMLVAATLFGAMTHVVWDSFTHASGEAVRSISILQAPIFFLGGKPVFLYKVLQHASTVFGLLVLVAAYWRWLGRGEARSERTASGQGFLFVAGLAGAAVFLGTCGALWIAPPAVSVSHLVVRTVVFATTVFAALYVALGMLLVRAK